MQQLLTWSTSPRELVQRRKAGLDTTTRLSKPRHRALASSLQLERLSKESSSLALAVVGSLQRQCRDGPWTWRAHNILTYKQSQRVKTKFQVQHNHAVINSHGSLQNHFWKTLEFCFRFSHWYFTGFFSDEKSWRNFRKPWSENWSGQLGASQMGLRFGLSFGFYACQANPRLLY